MTSLEKYDKNGNVEGQDRFGSDPFGEPENSVFEHCDGEFYENLIIPPIARRNLVSNPKLLELYIHNMDVLSLKFKECKED